MATGVPKPAATQMCMSTSACTYTWQTGAFGACSSTCGAGTASRVVSCQRSDGAAVDSSFCPSPGPETSTDCRDCSTCATASSLTMRMDIGDLASDGIDVFKVVVQLDTESLQANDSANNIRATTFAELAVLVNDAFFAIDPNVWVTSTADSLVITDALGRPFETTLAKGTYVAVTATNAVTHWVITATPSRSQCENPN